jgi:hypothetical protein
MAEFAQPIHQDGWFDFANVSQRGDTHFFELPTGMPADTRNLFYR